MKFNRDTYIKEMKSMVDKSIDKLLIEKPGYEIYTMSICTDPDSATSSINFDSKGNSDNKVKKLNENNKKYFAYHVAEGEFEQAKFFENSILRNCNPADFELPDYNEINNLSIPVGWEVKTKGSCWDELGPALKEIGDYTYAKIKGLTTHPDFELSVNGRLDWYELTWRAQ
jgi:hypothetical protein